MLKKGVIIHIHDILYPFFYWKTWLRWNWNETYLIRAFLQNNNDYKILYFNHYMGVHHPTKISEINPKMLSRIGSSLYLEKIR